MIPRRALPELAPLATIPSKNRISKTDTAMILIVAAWLVREFQQVLSGRTAGTFSNLVWVLLGDRYTLRWFLLMGATCGLLAWLVAHFGWHADWRVLLVLVGACAAAGAAGYGLAHWLIP